MTRLRAIPLLPLALLVLAACAGDKAAERGAPQRTPPDEPWRAQRPKPGPEPELVLPAFQSVELKNGLTLYVVEQRGLPIVAGALVTRAGSGHEAGGESGLASITYDMLDEGAAGMNAVALSEALQEAGAALSSTAGREHGMLVVEATKPNLDRSMELLAAIVQKPTFANEDFERIKGQHLAMIRANEGDAGMIARDAFASAAYGGEHPYGRPHEGTAASVEKLTARQAKRFWTNLVGPKTSALILAGDLSLDEAKTLAEKHFGRWRGSAKPPKPPADVGARGGVKLYVVDFPGAPQTSIRVGRPLLKKGDPDEAALLVFNQILGGNFTSRLNMKLREEKQWTYGAFSVLDARSGQGPFVAIADVFTPTTAEAVKEVLAQFEAMRAAPPTDAEVALAKDGWIKSLPGMFGLLPNQIGAAADLFLYDLPPDYFRQQIEKVKAVTPADVQRVAQRALQNEEMVVVLVGDKGQILEGVRGLGLGEPTMLARDGLTVAP